MLGRLGVLVVVVAAMLSTTNQQFLLFLDGEARTMPLPSVYTYTEIAPWTVVPAPTHDRLGSFEDRIVVFTATPPPPVP